MGEEKKLIYLDNAATTKTAPEVVEAMLPYFTELYGNPSSVYSFSQKSKEAITAGREKIAKTLGANPEEIYFTAGGSESDNWALTRSGRQPWRWRDCFASRRPLILIPLQMEGSSC